MSTESSAPASAPTASEASAPVSEAPQADVSVEEASSEVESSSPAPEAKLQDNGKYEVTIDGQKYMLTREQLINGWQTNAAAFKRFEEAAKVRKEAEKALTSLKQNPLQAFLEAGGDEAAFRAIAEDYLINKLEYEKMSPEQKELAELRRYREEQEAARQQEASKREQEQLSKETQAHMESYSKTFGSALSSAGIEATPKAISIIAQMQYDAMEQGYELPVETAVSYYKEQQTNEIKGYLSGLNPEQLIELLGPKANDIRKHEIANLKNPTPRPKKSAPQPKVESSKVPASQFFANLK